MSGRLSVPVAPDTTPDDLVDDLDVIDDDDVNDDDLDDDDIDDLDDDDNDLDDDDDDRLVPPIPVFRLTPFPRGGIQSGRGEGRWR